MINISKAGDVQGLAKAIVLRIDRVRTLILNASEKAAIESNGIILSNTIPEVPRDTGALRASGKNQIERLDRGFSSQQSVSGFVAFGGQTPVTGRNSPGGIVDYADYVHEDLVRSYTVGGPKYLEKGLA